MLLLYKISIINTVMQKRGKLQQNENFLILFFTGENDLKRSSTWIIYIILLYLLILFTHIQSWLSVFIDI